MLAVEHPLGMIIRHQARRDIEHHGVGGERVPDVGTADGQAQPSFFDSRSLVAQGSAGTGMGRAHPEPDGRLFLLGFAGGVTCVAGRLELGLGRLGALRCLFRGAQRLGGLGGASGLFRLGLLLLGQLLCALFSRGRIACFARGLALGQHSLVYGRLGLELIQRLLLCLRGERDTLLKGRILE